MPMRPTYGLSDQNDYAESNYGQLDSAIDSTQAGWYTGLGGVANSLGAEGVKDWALQNQQKNLQQAAHYTPTGPQRIEDVEDVGEFFGFAGDKIVENIPQMAATLTGTGLGALVGGVPGAIAGAAATAIPSHLGEAFGEQQDKGIDDPLAMYGSAGINTALEFAPAGALVGAFRRTAVKQMGGGTLARAVGTNVAAEAATEPLQGAVVKGSVGEMPEFSLQTPEQKAYWLDRLNEAAAGGIVGGAMGGGAHMASYPGQALSQASELPGKTYDTVTGAIDNMRGITPEEQAAKAQAKAEQDKAYGFMGQSTDPAFMDAGRSAIENIQNKIENNIPLTSQESQMIMSLPEEESRALLTGATEIKEQAQNDKDNRIYELNRLTKALLSNTQTEQDSNILDSLTPEEVDYIESNLDEAESIEGYEDYMQGLQEDVDTAETSDTAPEPEERDTLKYIAERIFEGTINKDETAWFNKQDEAQYAHVRDLVEQLENEYNVNRASDEQGQPIVDIDEDIGPTLNPTDVELSDRELMQFQQGSSEEGDFQSTPEAELISLSEKNRGRRYMGTGKINETTGKQWNNMRPEVYSAQTVGLRKNHTSGDVPKEEQKFQDTLAEYNKSGQRKYRDVPLLDALTQETVRDFADTRKEGTDISFKEMLQTRKAQAVEYVIGEKNTKFAENMRIMREKGDLDGILSMFRAIESEPLDNVVNREEFDFEQRQKLEPEMVLSDNLSKDTSSLAHGYLPLKPDATGKLNTLNLPKALTARMLQLREMGETGLSIEEIKAHDKPNSDITPELVSLRRDALTSVLSEYADRLSGPLIRDDDVLTASGMGNIPTSDKLQFIKDMRQVNISGPKNPNRFTVRDKIELEVAATPERTLEKGFVPVKTAARHLDKDKTSGEFKNKFDRSGDGFVLDMRQAIKARRIKLKKAGLPFTGRDALQSIMAEYKGEFGTNAPITMDEVIDKVSAVNQWEQEKTASGEVLDSKKLTTQTPDKLLAITETEKTKAYDKELKTKLAALQKEQETLNATAQLPMLNQEMSPTFTPAQKADWNSDGNKAQRKENATAYLKNYLAMDEINAVIADESGALKAAREKATKLDTPDFYTIREEVIEGINTDKDMSKKYDLHKPAFESEEHFEANRAKNQYTDKEADFLTKLGMSRNSLINAEYSFEDITTAFKTATANLEESKGRFDPGATVQEIDDSGAGDAQQTTLETQKGNVLGKEGINKKSFDKSLKKAMENEMATATEGAGKDDRSTVSYAGGTINRDQLKDTINTLDIDIDVLQKAIAHEKALLANSITLPADAEFTMDSVDETLHAKKVDYLETLKQRKEELQDKLDYPDDAVMDATVSRAQSEDAAQVEKTRAAAAKKGKDQKSYQYDKLHSSIDQRKDAIARNEKRIEQAKERNNYTTAKAIENAEKAIATYKADIARAQAKIEALPESARPDILKKKGTIRLTEMDESRTKLRKELNITDPKDWKPTGKTGDVISKADPLASKNNGSVIRDTAEFAGETIPLAYVYKPDGVKQTLLVHKFPGTNKWMVSIPGTTKTITDNHTTKKAALSAARDAVQTNGVNKVNALIQEARDAVKKPSEVSSLFAIPTETQGKQFNESRSESLTTRGFNSSNTMGSILVKETQTIADKMLKGTGIKARIVDGIEAEKVAERLGIDDYKLGIASGSLHGFAESVPNKDGSYNVYVNPAMRGKLREEILAHEIGHVTMYGSVMDKTTTAKEAQAVLKSYSDWLTKYGKDDTLFKELVESKKSPEAALLYLKSELGKYHMGALGKETNAYMKDFDEWYADEAGKALLRKLKNQSSRGFVEKYFAKLVELLRRVFKKTSAVENFLVQLSEQTKPQYVLSREPMPRNLSAVQTKLNKAVSKQYNASMLQVAKDLLLDKDWNLRNFKIPAFTELADLMHKKRGDKTVDNSYWSAKLTHMSKYDEHVTSIMRGATKEQQRQIMSELYNEKLTDAQVSSRTVKIRSLFRDLQQYMEDAGIEIKARKNYFPEIADVEYVEKHEEEFKIMMTRYPKHMEGIAKKWNEDVEKRNHHLNRVTKPEELLAPEDVPQAIYENIVKTEGVFDETASGQQTPNVRFLNHRIVSFLEGRDKFEWETNYLQSSVTDATATYITQTVKRVEYEKRFGHLDDYEQQVYIAYLMDRGGRTAYSVKEKEQFERAAKLTNKFEWLLKRAQDQGATAKQIQKARTYLAAEMGTLGRHTAMWLNERLGIPMPPAHSPINQALQGGISTLMSVANVWVLGMSTLTSIADPIGIAVRTGSLGQAFSSFKIGLAANFSKDRTQLKVLAEAIGSISDIATKEALAHGYNMAYMTPAVKRMNDKFFRLIGLEQWTQATRLMAVDAAQGFIKRHDPDNSETPTNKHSARFLRELGLRKGDIKYGSDGKIRILSYEQYEKATKQEQESNDRLRSAIAEFVDEAILRPNPSQRPAWASDPHYALLFHLKSFMYAFQKTILNPLVHEARNGNYMPLLMMGTYIPVMIAVGLSKDMLKTLGDGDDDWTPTYKANWDVFDYMWDGAEKGGLFGIAQPILDIRRDMRYGGSGIGALYSPGLDPDTFTQLPVPFNYSYQNLFEG